MSPNWSRAIVFPKAEGIAANAALEISSEREADLVLVFKESTPDTLLDLTELSESSGSLDAAAEDRDSLKHVRLDQIANGLDVYYDDRAIVVPRGDDHLIFPTTEPSSDEAGLMRELTSTRLMAFSVDTILPGPEPRPDDQRIVLRCECCGHLYNQWASQTRVCPIDDCNLVL